MGTNYYLRSDTLPPCECCGRPYVGTDLHIGKSSAGWCFALHVIPEMGINSLEDWKRLFSPIAITDEEVSKEMLIRLGVIGATKIIDEYGDTVSLASMLAIITERGHDEGKRPLNTSEWYSQNSATPGPRGLARSIIDGTHCIGHGPNDATYDLIAGDFS